MHLRKHHCTASVGLHGPCRKHDLISGVASSTFSETRSRIISLRSTPSRHGAIAQAFHWLTVTLVVAAYALSKSDGNSLYSAEADALRRVHETLGTVLLLVVALRLLWGRFDDKPPRRQLARWMAAASTLSHLLLYGLLVSIPAMAVLGTWLEGIPLTLLGVDIAPQLAPAQGLGQLIMALHTSLGNAMPWAAGIHASAAILHHFYLGDDVLRSMLPGE